MTRFTRDIKEDQKGVAGFFLDVPVLLIIILTIVVFSVTIHNVYISNEEEKNNAELDDISLQIKDDLYEYEVLYDLEAQKISTEKLSELEDEELETYLNVRKEHMYNIEINTIEGEEAWNFGAEIPVQNSEKKISTYRSPISIIGGEGRTYLGKLVVSVWYA